MAFRTDDKHDRQLLDRVAPDDWEQPVPAGRYNLVVLGGGTAGLVAAHGAAGLGARVALVESALLGGDCLVSGCVPSKALIASAAVAEGIRKAPLHGITAGPPDVSFPLVMSRMRRIRAAIAHDDSALRLRDAGVDVFRGRGRFVGRDRLQVEGPSGEAVALSFAKALVATGAEAVLPPIPGLEDALADGRAVTHEGLFAREQLPDRLVVLGAGPVGCELAQALRRLGSEVRIVDRADRLLPADEPDASEAVAAAFTAEGIGLHLGARVARVEADGVVLEDGVLDDGVRLACDLLLVATGRRPRTHGLGLDAAGVAFDEAGVTVDEHLVTTNPDIFASGDVASSFRYTHAADALSRVVVANALFFGRRRASALVIPRCTYTTPEVAHVGLPWDQADARDDLRCFTRAFAENDRARVEGDTDGYVRAWATRDGTIHAATVVGTDAGELIATLSLAMQTGATLADLSAAVLPYPTRSFALHRLGDAFNRTRLPGYADKALDALMKLRR